MVKMNGKNFSSFILEEMTIVWDEKWQQKLFYKERVKGKFSFWHFLHGELKILSGNFWHIISVYIVYLRGTKMNANA